MWNSGAVSRFGDSPVNNGEQDTEIVRFKVRKMDLFMGQLVTKLQRSTVRESSDGPYWDHVDVEAKLVKVSQQRLMISAENSSEKLGQPC